MSSFRASIYNVYFTFILTFAILLQLFLAEAAANIVDLLRAQPRNFASQPPVNIPSREAPRTLLLSKTLHAACPASFLPSAAVGTKRCALLALPEGFVRSEKSFGPRPRRYRFATKLDKAGVQGESTHDFPSSVIAVNARRSMELQKQLEVAPVARGSVVATENITTPVRSIAISVEPITVPLPAQTLEEVNALALQSAIKPLKAYKTPIIGSHSTASSKMTCKHFTFVFAGTFSSKAGIAKFSFSVIPAPIRPSPPTRPLPSLPIAVRPHNRVLTLSSKPNWGTGLRSTRLNADKQMQPKERRIPQPLPTRMVASARISTPSSERSGKSSRRYNAIGNLTGNESENKVSETIQEEIKEEQDDFIEQVLACSASPPEIMPLPLNPLRKGSRARSGTLSTRVPSIGVTQSPLRCMRVPQSPSKVDSDSKRLPAYPSPAARGLRGTSAIELVTTDNSTSTSSRAVRPVHTGSSGFITSNVSRRMISVTTAVPTELHRKVGRRSKSVSSASLSEIKEDVESKTDLTIVEEEEEEEDDNQLTTEVSTAPAQLPVSPIQKMAFRTPTVRPRWRVTVEHVKASAKHYPLSRYWGNHELPPLVEQVEECTPKTSRTARDVPVGSSSKRTQRRRDHSQPKFDPKLASQFVTMSGALHEQNLKTVLENMRAASKDRSTAGMIQNITGRNYKRPESTSRNGKENVRMNF